MKVLCICCVLLYFTCIMLLKDVEGNNDVGCKCTSFTSNLNTTCTNCSSGCSLFGCYCKKPCGSNTYRNTIQRNGSCGLEATCKPCHENCEGCHGKESTDCNKCKTYKYSSNDTRFDCVKRCPSETVEYIAQKECVSCGIPNCIACKRGDTAPPIEDHEKCEKLCRGIGYNNSQAHQCETCHDPYYLIAEYDDLKSCTCCVDKCPSGYENKLPNKCIKVVDSETWCSSSKTVCNIVIPVVAAGFVLFIVVVCCCCVCRKKMGKKKKTIKSPPPALEELEVRRVRDNKEQEDAQSNESATVAPLLSTSDGPAYANITNTNPPMPPPMRPDNNNIATQEVYMNIEEGDQGDAQQEIYVNEDVDVKPTLPPPRKTADDEDERADYENEEAIEQMAATNPRVKAPPLKPAQNNVLPSPMGHKTGKNKGYANQNIIDKHEKANENTTDTSPAYENTMFESPNNKGNPGMSGKSNLSKKPVGHSTKGDILTRAVPPPSGEDNTQQKSSVPYYNVLGKNGNYYNTKS